MKAKFKQVAVIGEAMGRDGRVCLRKLARRKQFGHLEVIYRLDQKRGEFQSPVKLTPLFIQLQSPAQTDETMIQSFRLWANQYGYQVTRTQVCSDEANAECQETSA